MTYLSRRVSAALAGLILGALALISVPALADETARKQESEARLRRDVTYLASDQCEGRGPNTKGLSLAADYIANEFKKAGLKPGNPNGTYFQPFTIPGKVLLTPPTLVLKGPQGQVVELKPGVDFDAMGLSTSGSVQDAPVVFAGYGVSSDAAKYDDYENMDVAGKVLVLLRDVPRSTNAEYGARLRQQASFASKLSRAKAKKATAVLFVHDADAAKTGDDLLDFNYTAIGQAANQGALPAIHMHRSVLENMLHGSYTGELNDLEKSIDRDWKPQSMALKGWKASLNVKTELGKIHLKNVIGTLDGAGPLANQIVVVGAHYDHLGYGGGFGSLARLKKPAIHHGADDNGSGSTSVMELARRFAAIPNRQGRRLVFMTFSGEELGLLGSRHYCKEPLYPLENTSAMFNLDMVGRLKTKPSTNKESLKVEGANTAKTFNALLDAVNKKHGFVFEISKVVPANSDHYSFYKPGYVLTDKALAALKADKVPEAVLTKLAGLKGKPFARNEFVAELGKALTKEELESCQGKLLQEGEFGIPVLFFWTGIHADYHRPSDTADKINVAGMRQIVDLSEDVIRQLTTQEQRPEYVKVASGGGGGGPRGDGPRLGVIPVYDPEAKTEGFLIDGVSPGSPAAKAGLKQGDRIVQLARKPVKNIQSYMQIMGGMKKGDMVEVGIVRDGKPQSLTATLE